MKNYKIKKLTDNKWLNLYDLKYTLPSGKEHSWTFVSRKNQPIKNAHKPDAVYIIPIFNTDNTDKLVVTCEFRAPLGDYEYGFPAGLIDEGETVQTTAKRELKEETGLDLTEILHVTKPIYTSAGMTDESTVMLFARAEGTITTDHLEDAEDIETILMDPRDVAALLESDKKIAAKAWSIFYLFAKTGKIT